MFSHLLSLLITTSVALDRPILSTDFDKNVTSCCQRYPPGVPYPPSNGYDQWRQLDLHISFNGRSLTNSSREIQVTSGGVMFDMCKSWPGPLLAANCTIRCVAKWNGVAVNETSLFSNGSLAARFNFNLGYVDSLCLPLNTTAAEEDCDDRTLNYLDVVILAALGALACVSTALLVWCLVTRIRKGDPYINLH